MSLDSDLSSEGLAALIVDALLHAGIISKENFEKALAIAAEETDVRKAAGDYWCSLCPRSRPWENKLPDPSV